MEEIINNEEKREEKALIDLENEERIKRLNKEASENFQRVLKEKLKEENAKKMEKYTDRVCSGKVGWKERYYMISLRLKSMTQIKKLIKQSYIEGICWVFSYYYNGCVSWEWYYPFHYAPFASDLCHIEEMKIDFKLGVPFNPIEQLFCVLPYSTCSSKMFG